MNFEKLNGKTIQDAFEDFDKANPKVYDLFKQEVLRAVNTGKRKLSAKTILGWIRWEVFIRTTDDTLPLFSTTVPEKFKINDAYTSRYARKFVNDFPQYKDVFEIRELRSN